MSPHQAVSSSWDLGEKVRLIRSGASEVAPGSGVVVTLKRRLQRPTRPSAHHETGHALLTDADA